jgi:hypothetical protein
MSLPRPPAPPPPLVPVPLLGLIACAVVFVGWTGQQLPPLVASHFNGAGVANGHMPRAAYLTIMLLITALVPLLMVVVPGLALRGADARINIPNRSYWLSPERRAQTQRFLSRQMASFAALVILFLCYVQWLVVRANLTSPAAMSSQAFAVGLALFLGCTLAWTLRIIRRFVVRP